MLMRTIIFASLAAALATQVPSLLESGAPPAAPLSANVLTTSGGGSGAAMPALGGGVRVEADRQGHYIGSFSINGKPVQGMIDTGATFVAINESLARHLGFGANRLDFRYAVSTANGQTSASHVVLDRIEIGGIRVRDVDAIVLKDDALSATLVGMSFLQKLGSYSVADGTLNLRQ